MNFEEKDMFEKYHEPMLKKMLAYYEHYKLAQKKGFFEIHPKQQKGQPWCCPKRNGGNHMEKKNKVHKIVGKGFTCYTFTDLTPEMIEYAKRDAAANGCVFLEASMEEFESSTGMVQLSDAQWEQN